MSVQNSVKSRQRLTVEYTDMATIEAIAHFLDLRVRTEAAATGVKPEAAMSNVARHFKSSIGTVANILRCKNGKSRVKSVCFNLGSRIIRAAIEDIEAQQARLEKDRERLLDLAVNADTAALAEAQEGLRLQKEGAKIVADALARMKGATR